MLRVFIVLFCVIASVCLGLACSLQGAEPEPGFSELDILMPPCPPAWEDLGRTRGISLRLMKATNAGLGEICRGLPFGGRARIAAPPEDFAVFIALPEAPGLSLRQIGGFYPLDARGRRLSLDFYGGWMAACALEGLGRSEKLTASFDWPRLRVEAQSRLGDPWLCSPEALGRKIAEAAFTTLLLKEAPLFPLDLEAHWRVGAEEECLWFFSSPFASPVLESGGRLALLLPAGKTILYRGRERLFLELAEGGGCRFFHFGD